MSEETIAALLRERIGYERRLGYAEEELPTADSEGRKEYLEREVKDCALYIKNVNTALKAEGFDPAPPAKRAETRPALGEEKRGPGRPRKAE
jgi:hypothetical protein